MRWPLEVKVIMHRASDEMRAQARYLAERGRSDELYAHLRGVSENALREIASLPSPCGVPYTGTARCEREAGHSGDHDGNL